MKKVRCRPKAGSTKKKTDNKLYDKICAAQLLNYFVQYNLSPLKHVNLYRSMQLFSTTRWSNTHCISVHHPVTCICSYGIDNKYKPEEPSWRNFHPAKNGGTKVLIIVSCIVESTYPIYVELLTVLIHSLVCPTSPRASQENW